MTHIKASLLAVTLLAVLQACGEPPVAQDGFVYLVEDVPAGLDSDGPAANLPTSQVAMVNLMDPLLEYARTHTAQNGVTQLDFTRFEGRLAKRWRYDEARQAWIFTLRDDVVSCAGNLLTADDVVYSFARAKSVSGSAPIGWFLASVASVKGFDVSVLTDETKRALGNDVEKISQFEVAIRQSDPNVLLLPVLTTFGFRIFDKAAAQAHATPDDPWAHRHINTVDPLGFGPYCLKRWRKGEDMVWEANPNYYRGMARIKRVVLKRVPQSSNRLMIMQMGQAQLTDRLTPREYLKLKQDERVTVSSIIGNENLFIHMNFSAPPFDNPLVRKAVAAAIPYQWIVDNAYFGQAKPWRSLIPTRFPGAKDTFSQSGQDLKAAAQLLVEAGFPSGAGLEAYEASFQLTYVAEKENALGPIATAIRTALRSIGMPVTLNPIPLTQYGDRQLVKRDLPFALNDQEKPAVVDAGYAIQLFFASPEAGGVNNMVNFRDTSVDEAWARARIETDGKRRRQIVDAIQETATKAVAWLPVVEFQTQWAHRPGLSGITWYPDNALRFYDLELAQ